MKRSTSQSALNFHRRVTPPGRPAVQDSSGGMGESKGGGPAGPNPSWQALAKLYWGQYVWLLCAIVLLAISERLSPFHHVMYSKTDLEYWKYSYPLKADQVPPWAVPLIAVFSPVLVVLGFYLSGRISRLEAHHSVLMAVSCVAVNGVITNFVKISVGRHRPDFVARCWPNGKVPEFKPDGRPACSEDAINPDEGRKSFPSGHTSWSTAGLGYLMFWLLGKLRCFDGNPHPMRFVTAILPLLGALWIGLTRFQDYWHHWEDIACGFALGLLMAFCFYRQIYPGVMGRCAGTLTASKPPLGSSSAANRSLSTVFSPLLDEPNGESVYDRADSRV